MYGFCAPPPIHKSGSSTSLNRGYNLSGARTPFYVLASPAGGGEDTAPAGVCRNRKDGRIMKRRMIRNIIQSIDPSNGKAMLDALLLWTRDDYLLHPPPDGAPAEKASQGKEGWDDGRSSSPDSVMIDSMIETDVAVTALLEMQMHKK